MRLGSNKSALRASVRSRKLSALLATPDRYLPTVWALEFCSSSLRWDDLVA